MSVQKAKILQSENNTVNLNTNQQGAVNTSTPKIDVVPVGQNNNETNPVVEYIKTLTNVSDDQLLQILKERFPNVDCKELSGAIALV